MTRTRSIPSLALLAALALPAGAAAATVTVGPYVRDLRPDGATIAWETDVAATGALAFGETADLGQTAEATTTEGTRHQASVTGLPAASLRHYRVMVDGQLTGRAGTFVTAPVEDRPFTFLVYGDCRSDEEAHRLVMSRMVEHPADFFVNTGDLVSDGDKEEQWVLFFDIVKDLAGDTLLLANVGNHDTEAVSPPSRFLKRLGGFGPDGGLTTWRRFDFAGSRFLLLDNFDAVTADMDCFMRTGAFTLCINAPQTAWLQGELDAAAKDPAVRHVFVVVHEGPYSSKPDRVGSADMRSWLNAFASSKVRVVLSGHDHYYEHGRSANGLDYIISGGGGASLYETVPVVEDGEPPHEILTSTSVYHFLRITVDGDRIDVTAFGADGTEMESYGIAMPRPCEAVEDCSDLAAGMCDGAWTCPAGECAWACKPPSQCGVPEDCEWRDPGDCDGSWSCDADEQCAWVCDPAEDLGTVAPDVGGTADSGPVAPPDAVVTTDTAQPPDTALPSDPGGTDTPGEKAKSGGCAAGANTGFPAWILLLAAVALLRRRSAA